MLKKKTPNETDVLVGARVRVRRLQIGLTQTTLGDRVGITFQQIQKYEKGTNRIGASRLAAIAGVLEVPVGYFFPVPDEGGMNAETRPAEVLDLLGTPGALDLLRDFAGIPDRAARKALCVMAKVLAAETGEGAAGRSPPRH